MHQPVEDDDDDGKLWFDKDPAHVEGCTCLKCYCLALIQTEDENDEIAWQESIKAKDGTPTVQDLHDMMSLE